MYEFNELQQEGLGAATLRQALITSVGCLNSKGQAVTTMYSQNHFQDYPMEIDDKKSLICYSLVPLLTLQDDNIRNAAFALSAGSFLEIYEYTTFLQSLIALTLFDPPKGILSPTAIWCPEIISAASIIAAWQIGLQHSLRGSTVRQASSNLLLLTTFSNVVTSCTAQEPPVRFDDVTEQSAGIVMLALLLTRMLTISEKQSVATASGRTNLSDFTSCCPWNIWSKLTNCGQHITFPTSAANGWEQSDAAVSITLEMAWKSVGHLPVNFGSYVSGKVGYIGGVQGRAGDAYLGMTDGDTSMGPDTPIPGGFANSEVVDLLLCSLTL